MNAAEDNRRRLPLFHVVTSSNLTSGHKFMLLAAMHWKQFITRCGDPEQWLWGFEVVALLSLGYYRVSLAGALLWLVLAAVDNIRDRIVEDPVWYFGHIATVVLLVAARSQVTDLLMVIPVLFRAVQAKVASPTAAPPVVPPGDDGVRAAQAQAAALAAFFATAGQV